jgi:hypothetical protein
MSCAADGDDVVYHSRRTHRRAPAAEFAARYGPSGPAIRAAPGSLEHWLTERYCLYAAKPDGAVLRGEIHHAPWPLEPAHATIDTNSMAGFALPDGAPHLLFARELEVVAWAPERVAG